MSALREFDTDRLLQAAAGGDDQAAELLLGRHRERLKSMIAIRLAPQLAARLDASDVVQDVLVQAHDRLAEYLSEKPIAVLSLVAKDRNYPAHRFVSASRTNPKAIYISRSGLTSHVK